MAATFICYLVTLVTTLTLAQDLTFKIQEEGRIGDLVGSAKSANFTIPPDEVESVRYNFLRPEHRFSIDDISGNIFTTVAINREEVCSGIQLDTECKVEFSVTAKSSGIFYQTIGIKIIIEDINDNAPMFDEIVHTLQISEGANVNSEYPIPSADDADAGTNSIERYELTPPDNTFELHFVKNLVGTFKISIVVKEPLNREVKSSYQLQVTAWDGGNPSKSGTMIVNIEITDINDNSPIFDQTEYAMTVEEGTSKGVTVLTVQASDDDIDENGLVSYRIQEGFVVTDFALNTTSGDIYVATDELVYRPDRIYEFVVEAYDHGPQSKSTEAWVRISVIDTGNNEPKVTIDIQQGNINFVNVSENAVPGFFVAHVTVEDTDTGMNGDVSCSVQGNFFGIEKLGDKAYKVVVKNPLNREISSLHTVNVTCTDKGEPPLSSSKSFLVRVTDYNDNKPIFVNHSYTATIPENTNQEQIVLQVLATDQDIGVNQEIHYEIRNSDNRLSINPMTGVVSVKPFFDRESTPVVVFEVLAIDRGNPALTGTATVTLSIEDKNDKPPEFQQTSYTFEITENMPSGTSVGKLTAKDNDIGTNAAFTFSISPESSMLLPFAVMPQDGVIQTIRALDREEAATYTFIAIATDQGEPPLEDSVTVTVVVKDENDNEPAFEFPVNNNRTVTISYPNNNLEFVTQILAKDKDAGENGTIDYSIISGNDLGLFICEKSSGRVTIADHDVKIDKDVSVVLTVEIKDNGPERLASTAELIINITYSNATYEEIVSDTNKIIVIVVVVLTVLCSGIIIAVILLLRKRDAEKKAADERMKSENTNNYSSKPSVYILNNTGESSTDYQQPTHVDMIRKKKEVSFSLDEHDSINNYSSTNLHVSLAPEPIKYAPEKPPRQGSPDSTSDLYDKVTTRLETLKLQQMLMETRAKQHQHPISHGNPDDSRSESSGETSSGDSGRGASEEEIPSTSPSHDDHVFEYSLPMKSVPSTSQQTSHNTSRADNYSLVPPPIPTRTYKPYSSFNTNHNYSSINQYLNEPSSYCHSDYEILDSSKLSWQPQPHPPHSHQSIKSNNYANSTYAYVPTSHLSAQYRRRSQDDDDCSTTTSGSYTLHSIEDLL